VAFGFDFDTLLFYVFLYNLDLISIIILPCGRVEVLDFQPKLVSCLDVDAGESLADDSMPQTAAPRDISQDNPPTSYSRVDKTRFAQSS
jgi:hypothetical protein